MVHRLKIAGVAWAAWILVSACGQKEAEPLPPREEPVAVRVVAVERTMVPVERTAIGTTAPYARAMPATRLIGRLQAVPVEIGDSVREGQVLARVESADLQARGQQAEASLRSAQAAEHNADKRQARLRALYRDGAATQEELDRAETEFLRARAAVAAAGEGIGEVKGLLQYAAVLAPFDGVVVHKSAQAGDVARPGVPLLTIERLDSLNVDLTVTEGDLAFLSVGRQVEVEVGSLGKAATARVRARVPAADAASRTFRVRAVMANPGLALGSGVFVRARFAGFERPAVLVPVEAVVRRGQLHGVFVVGGGRARLRWLRLGRQMGESYEALSGLEPGERIVGEPPSDLRDGTRLEAGRDG